MTAPAWVIRGGRVVDPASGHDGVADVLVRDGRIAAVGEVGDAAGTERFDATGLVVAPGLIDVHVHLREPGGEAKETIATGTAAAAAGGFTAVCCMPNTAPALDSVDALRDLAERVRRDGRVRVYPIAAITRERRGVEPVAFAALAAAGAVGFSDDGDTTANSAIMRRALAASRELDLPVMVHCEDKALAAGAMHEGAISRSLGLPGIPAEAEEIVIARDLMLARLTGGRLHVCHVSTGRGIALIRQAKAEGVRVTAEVMPHHLVMSDRWVAGDRTLHNTDDPAGNPARPADPETKVNPPLRSVEDTRLLLAALQDGAFDLVATDHAPHAVADKAGKPFAAAAFGLNGSETALPLMLALVRAGHVSLPDVIRWLTIEPAKLLRSPLGTLSPGAPADVMVFDPQERWVLTPETMRSKSKNTPLLGMTLLGRVRLTVVEGKERYRA